MSLGPEQLSQLQAQRDNFQRDIDKSYIRNEQAEQEVMRNLNEWRRNFANLSIALGAAIIPLTFFTEKEPNYPATFFSAVLLLIVNGLQIYY